MRRLVLLRSFGPFHEGLKTTIANMNLPRIFRLLILLHGLFNLTPGDAATATGELAPVTSVAASSPTSPASQNPEVLILRAQLADSQKFQEQILSTVFWSLGAVAGVTLLLVGFGWFTNFRVYERDRTSLERELRSHLVEEISRAKAEASQAAIARFSEQEHSLVSSVAGAETRISTSTNAIIQIAAAEVRAKHDALSSTTKSLRREVHQLQLANKIAERQDWLVKKNFRNALQASVTALDLANRIEFEYSVGQVLDMSTEDIASILASNARPIDNFLVGQLVAALDAVKGQHAHAAAALKGQAAKLLNA